MTVTASQIRFYAATTVDYEIALGAAAIAIAPASSVTGDFYTAWNLVANSKYLVIAVGGAANNALTYNPCGWSNPAGQGAGATPFVANSGPLSALPGANRYENAAGSVRSDTARIATDYADYAIRGAYEAGYTSPPSPIPPSNTCLGLASVPCPCSGGSGGTLGGSVVSAPAGVKGFDTANVLTASTAGAYKADGFGYAIRYVSREATEQPGDLTHSEALDILGAKLALMPVQHVENPGWTPTGNLGTSYGTHAASHASEIGFPTGVNVWLDLEGIAPGTPVADIIAYCNNWADAVSNAGFVPGVYVGYDTFLSSDQLAALHFTHFWKSFSTVPAVTGRGYQLIQTQGAAAHGVQYDNDLTQTDGQGGSVMWLQTS